MDWKAFLASLVGSLAWPLTIVFIVVVFRRQIRQILDHIKRFGAAGLSVELSDKIDKVVDAGGVVEVEKGLTAPTIQGLDPTLLALAKSFPSAALVQAFKDLEAVILQIRDRLPDLKPHRNLNEVLKVLRDKEYIPSSVLTLFQTLREARNAAAHGKGEEEMSSVEALELIQQIKLLQELLAQVLDQLPAQTS